MKIKDHGKLVIVQWGDAWSSEKRDYHPKEDHTPYKTRTPGYFMEENEQTVVLCRNFCEGNRYLDPFVIPKEMIEHIEIWEE